MPLRIYRLYNRYCKSNIEKFIYPIIFIGCITIFVPIIFNNNTNRYQYDTTNYALELKQSMHVHMALASSITCMVPFIFDSVYDISCLTFIKGKSDKYLTTLHRNIILLLVGLPDAYILFMAIPYEQFDIIKSVLNARDMLLTIYFLRQLNSFGNPHWNAWSYLLIGLPSVACNLIITFDSNLADNYWFNNGLKTLITISISAIIVYIIQVIISLNGGMKNNESINTLSLYNNILCVVYTILFAIFYISHWSIYLFPAPLSYHWQNIMSINHFTMNSCIITLCFSIIYCIGYRLQRIEVYETKVNIPLYHDYPHCLLQYHVNHYRVNHYHVSQLLSCQS